MGFFAMASWPGIVQPSFSPVGSPMFPFELYTHASRTLSMGDPWGNARSEINLRRNASFGSFLSQGHEQERQVRSRSSTLSVALQSLPLRLSEASPPQTTSTLPIFPYNPVNSGPRDESIASSSAPANKAQQWLPALPSQRSYFYGQVATPAQNDSAKLLKLLEDPRGDHDHP